MVEVISNSFLKYFVIIAIPGVARITCYNDNGWLVGSPTHRHRHHHHHPSVIIVRKSSDIIPDRTDLSSHASGHPNNDAAPTTLSHTQIYTSLRIA